MTASSRPTATSRRPSNRDIKAAISFFKQETNPSLTCPAVREMRAELLKALGAKTKSSERSETDSELSGDQHSDVPKSKSEHFKSPPNLDSGSAEDDFSAALAFLNQSTNNTVASVRQHDAKELRPQNPPIKIKSQLDILLETRATAAAEQPPMQPAQAISPRVNIGGHSGRAVPKRLHGLSDSLHRHDNKTNNNSNSGSSSMLNDSLDTSLSLTVGPSLRLPTQLPSMHDEDDSDEDAAVFDGRRRGVECQRYPIDPAYSPSNVSTASSSSFASTEYSEQAFQTEQRKNNNKAQWARNQQQKKLELMSSPQSRADIKRMAAAKHRQIDNAPNSSARLKPQQTQKQRQSNPKPRGVGGGGQRHSHILGDLSTLPEKHRARLDKFIVKPGEGAASNEPSCVFVLCVCSSCFCSSSCFFLFSHRLCLP